MTIALVSQPKSPAVASPRTVAVIGGGASGVLMAAHLLRSGDPCLHVVVVEKASSVGRGLAYSTNLPDHVLNVRATNMSAFADDAGHFVRWLRLKDIEGADPTTYFAPRRLYGEYLQDVLDQMSGPNLRVVDQACVDIVQRAEFQELRLADGSHIAADMCVLATGHDCGAVRGLSAASDGGSPDPTDRVLIIGSGLSMVDALLSLRLNGHVGEIVATSRRGMLPAVHKKTNPVSLERSDVPIGQSPLAFLQWLRKMVRVNAQRGGDWRDVVDGLRPHNQAIWRNWSPAWRRQFFRHAKAWWDVHRHRMAPAIGERVAQAIADGQLRVIAGRVLDVTPGEKGYRAIIQHRGGQVVEEISPRRIYDCGGVIADPRESSNPLIRSLLAGGMARTDQMRIGLDVDLDGNLINNGGFSNDRLFAIGPLTRGTFLEIEAIPDIRTQCAALATKLLLNGTGASNLRGL